MKSKLFLLIFCSLTITASAQKPEQGDIGFTLGITGLSTISATTAFGDMGTLLGRYYLQDDLALRGRIDLFISSDKSEFSDTSGFSTEDIARDRNIEVSGGLQKCFALNMKRLEPYITAEALIGIGKSGIHETTTNFGPDNSTVTEVDPGGTFTVGLVSNAGFNYYITNRIALGAEFGYGIDVSSTGEGTTTTTTTIDGDTSTSTEKTPKSNSFTLGGRGAEGVIMFSIFWTPGGGDDE